MQFKKLKKAERENYLKIFWGFFQRRTEKCKKPSVKDRNRKKRFDMVDLKQHQSSVLHLFKTFWSHSVFRNAIIIIMCRFAFLSTFHRRGQEEYCGI